MFYFHNCTICFKYFLFWLFNKRKTKQVCLFFIKIVLQIIMVYLKLLYLSKDFPEVKNLSKIWYHLDLQLLKENLILQIWIIIFPQIVSVETILFWKWKMWKFSDSFWIIAIFHFINWIVSAGTVEGGN